MAEVQRAPRGRRSFPSLFVVSMVLTPHPWSPGWRRWLQRLWLTTASRKKATKQVIFNRLLLALEPIAYASRHVYFRCHIYLVSTSATSRLCHGVVWGGGGKTCLTYDTSPNKGKRTRDLSGTSHHMAQPALSSASWYFYWTSSLWLYTYHSNIMALLL